MGADILHQGGRTAVAMFFYYGVTTLAPPPPVDLHRGMLAAFLVMMALVFFVTIELLSICFKWPDPSIRRKRKNNRRGKRPRGFRDNFVRELFLTLGMAATAGGHRRQTQ